MDSGFYAACAALMSRTQALDTVANNLANASTSGYRAQYNVFRSVLANTSGRSMSELNLATNDYGVLGGVRLDLSQGSLEKTGNDLDFGIEGPGFFVVQTPAGRVFTRSGHFQVSARGQLITAEGDPVMGDQGVIPVVGGGPLSVSSDGTISVNGAVSGKLKLVDFAPNANLQSVGKTYYSAAPADERPATLASVHQGMLESSNVNPVSSIVSLIGVQRTAEMMRHALSMFHSQMDRTAAQDLPQTGS
jgi:flagellar basal-body rod protein FlgF/flagellar basal-body rod protein FlgG